MGMSSVYLLNTKSIEAAVWVRSFVDSEPWQWLGSSLCIEHRYIDEILAGLKEAGLTEGIDFTIEP